MGDGTKENPYTREDVLRLIEENGGIAKGLDLSVKVFKKGIDLNKFDLEGIIFRDAVLSSAHLEGARLVVAHLEGADLMNANLVGAVLGGAQLKGARLGGAYLEGAYLAGAHLEGADLMIANLEGADLSGAHLEGAYLWRTEFSHDTQLDGTDWGNYILGEDKEGGFGEAENTYRRLKIWCTEHGIYDVAGKFFFREMTAKRKALKWRPNPLPRAWSKFLSLICGYGEGPFRVVASAAVVVVGLALIYFAIGTLTPNTFLNSLYYSAVSFTAVGYGSWVKDTTGWVKGLGAFEALVGVFMIALFLITFVRKMTR